MKGILFKEEMIRANAAGIKTMTRRLIKGTALDWLNDGFTPEFVAMQENNLCPYGKPGDILYTKEAFYYVQFDHCTDLLEGVKECRQYVFKSEFHEDWMVYAKEKYGYSWKSPLHMPREAARYFHRIKSIRCERIMDITPEDAIAEGIVRLTEDRLKSKPTRYALYSYEEYEKYGPPFYSSCPIDSFRSLWQMINGQPKPVMEKRRPMITPKSQSYIVHPWGDKDSMYWWEGVTTWRGKPLIVVPNPWVWVIEYENITYHQAMAAEWDKMLNDDDNALTKN